MENIENSHSGENGTQNADAIQDKTAEMTTEKVTEQSAEKTDAKNAQSEGVQVAKNGKKEIDFVPSIKIEDGVQPQTIYSDKHPRKKGFFVTALACVCVAFVLIIFALVVTILQGVKLGQSAEYVATIWGILCVYVAMPVCAVLGIISTVFFALSLKSTCRKIRMWSIALLVLSVVILALDVVSFAILQIK